MFKLTILLLILTSCASKPSLKDKSIDQLLSSIRTEGEGKGRLGLQQQQYLFSYEALMKENTDWLLAATIPLHGEEVMVLPRLKESNPVNDTQDALQLRIETALNQHFKDKTLRPVSQSFINEMRSLLRFVNSSKLQIKKNCGEVSHEESTCTMDGEKFGITSVKDKVLIKKDLGQGHFLELEALNLTGSFFQRTNFFLRSESQKDASILSLELFWK